jgi:pheromone shutdown-related protein TraB
MTKTFLSFNNQKCSIYKIQQYPNYYNRLSGFSDTMVLVPEVKITNIAENHDLIDFSDKQIHLIGTAHISLASVELVERVINEVKPDTVAIELCEQRYQSLNDPDKWRNTDMFTVIKERKTSLLLARLILASFQKKLGNQLEVQPGAEMLKAADMAKQLKAEILLADRSIRTTMSRVWGNLSLFKKSQLAGAMFTGIFKKVDITGDDIEKIKKQGALEEALIEFSKEFPSIVKPLIQERDQYIAQTLRSSTGKVIVAVIGAGHCPGIKKAILQDSDLDELSKIPPTKLSSILFAWFFPLIFILTMAYLSFYSSSDINKSNITSYLGIWSLVTMVCTCMGCIITVTHPITAIVTIFTAPITTLIPIFRPGLIAGITEISLKQPRVEDMESVLEDITSVKGWYRNRVARTLLIIMVINLLAKFSFIIFPIIALS